MAGGISRIRSMVVESRTFDRVDRLLRGCCRSTGLSGAGVTMLTVKGSREPFHATDATARVIEQLQLMLGEGPCVEATSRGAPVMVADIADDRDETSRRWPMFRVEALRAGIRAIFAFPMRVGAIDLGSVDMYRADPGGLSDRQVGKALLSVDRVAISILDQPGEYGPMEPGTVSDVLVHQAAGMVMVQANVSIEEALLRLRATAFAEGRALGELARDVVNGRRRLSEERS
jgi:hypothetical protein